MGCTQHPFDVLGGRNTAIVVPDVFYPQVNYFNRVRGLAKSVRQSLVETVEITLEDGVTRAMSNPRGLACSGREVGVGSNIAAFFISKAYSASPVGSRTGSFVQE